MLTTQFVEEIRTKGAKLKALTDDATQLKYTIGDAQKRLDVVDKQIEDLAGDLRDMIDDGDFDSMSLLCALCAPPVKSHAVETE